MTDTSLAQSTRLLTDYIKTQIPAITSDQHAETLAVLIIAGLPRLFAESPKIFSRVLLNAQFKQSIAQLIIDEDFNALINQIDDQMRRLDWTDTQGREHLEKFYGVRSRYSLSLDQLDNFLLYLQLTDSPIPNNQ
ncbi:hypothetical protein PQG02_06915 [Nostoc sp. UHCC 0926]|uniref:hypothetical protein n=1 Tax=unclassified Nostoc TaxID=2593658 RepID=UPI002360B24F|nr:hypothetical protein [Nostoc sp. UHCC 0926]WDD34072.1 hypothetical protein PQG02_06915 [Nostoc sp. UHCC 0926]